MSMQIIIGICSDQTRSITRYVPCLTPKRLGITGHTSQIICQFFTRRTRHDCSSLTVMGLKNRGTLACTESRATPIEITTQRA
jgi:hypothetical protein